MQHPRLYLDEDVHAAVAAGLRRRSYDVLATVEAGRSGSSDAEQLDFAASHGRCLFSFNRGDFASLHGELISSGGHHYGIVLSKQVHVGTVVRRLAEWLAPRTADDVLDHLVWLKV
jgi:hypothetical protein